MNMETIFSLSNLLVMPFWFCMIFLPRWHWTKRIMASPLVVVPAALVYVLLVLPQVISILPALMNPTLPAVIALLATPAGSTIAWVHFLTFDLFVGRWAYLDSRQLDVSVWLMGPILFFILMLGPAGFLIYQGVRGLWQRHTAAHPAQVLQ